MGNSILTGKDLLNFYLESNFKIINFDSKHIKVKGIIAEVEYTFVIPKVDIVDGQLNKILVNKIAKLF